MTSQARDSYDVRCPRCSKLLARRLPSGALEVRDRDRYRVIVVEGSVTCGRCDETVSATSSQRGQGTGGTWGASRL